MSESLAPQRRPSPRLLWVALGLALLAWLVYRPALNRVFVMDQAWYFAELGGQTSLQDGLRHYDYAATRRYWKGDDALFRPLLFAWLAVGNSVFSYHHVAWNIANLVLHVLVAIALFRLLWTIRPSPFAYLTAALFVVMKPPLELVVWNHLGGYLLACWWLLIGLRAFVELTRPDASWSRARLVRFVAAFTAAAFCHEAMVPIGVFAALLLVFEQRRKQAPVSARQTLALFAPVLMFGVAYAFHVARVARLTYVDRPDVHSLFDLNNVLGVVPRSVEVLAVWTRDVALPSAVTFVPVVFERLTKRFDLSWSWRQLANAGLCAAALPVLMMGGSRTNARKMAPMLVLVPLSLLAYAGIICLGRPLREVLDVTYYLYAFALLLLVFFYALIDVNSLSRPVRAIASVLLAGFVLVNGAGTHSTARAVGRANDDASVFLRRVEKFVDAHKHEPDFTFAISVHVRSVDPEIALKAGYPDDPGAAVTVKHLTEILFAKYYRENKPRYIFE